MAPPCPGQLLRRSLKVQPRAQPSAFARKVERIVRGIPRGNTLSYGEVALRAGKPLGARAVVQALHSLDDIPWWRVCRTGGKLAPAVAHEQEQLLRQEGWPNKPRRQNRLK